MDIWMMDNLNNIFLSTSADKTGVNGVCRTALGGYGLGCFLSSGVM